jgi:hypothetical protein
VGLYLLVFFAVKSPLIFDYYRVSDDIRQQIYPLHRAKSPDLFQNDLLTTYFLSHTPPFYYYFHLPFAYLLDPVVISKVSQFGLLFLQLLFLYLIGRKLHGAILGWLLVFLFMHSPALAGLTDGGLPRGYAAPAATLFVLAALESRIRLALASVTVGGLFYPPILLVLGPAFLVWTAYKRQFTWWSLPAAGLLAVGIYPMLFRTPEIGRIITLAEASSMPEWQQGSRFPFLPVPPAFRLASQYFVAAFSPASWAWLFVGLGAVGLFRSSPRREGRDHLVLFGSLIGLCLLMYAVAAHFAFRLHIPDRNFKYTLPVLGMILIGYGIFALAESVLRPLLGRLAGREAWGTAAAGFLVVLTAFYFGGSGLQGNLNLWANQRWAAGLYRFVATLPRDAVITGHPMDMDNLPLFSKRTVYVSDEAFQPLYEPYYSEIAGRLRRSYSAYYATDMETLRHFHLETGVRYILVRVEDFGRRFERERYYYDPYDGFIKGLIEGREAEDFLLAAPPSEAVIYRDSYYRLVDLAALIRTTQSFLECGGRRKADALSGLSGDAALVFGGAGGSRERGRK